VYAQHGRELMGCKSPEGEPAIQMLESFGAERWTTTSLRQGRFREEGSGGSQRQNCEPTDRNVIEGRESWGELAQHNKAQWFREHGK